MLKKKASRGRKALRVSVRRDLCTIDLTKWNSCKTDSDRRIEWIRLTNSLWDIDKDSNKFRDQAIKVVREYCAKNKIDVYDVNDSALSTHILIIGVLLSAGANYKPSQRYFQEYIENIDRTSPPVKKAAARATKVIAKRISKENHLLEQIELLEDDKLGNSDFSSLKGIGFTQEQLRASLNAIEPRYLEYRLASIGDAEVIEGYSYTKAQFKKICTWYIKLIDYLLSLVENIKATVPRKLRKPRKKKEKSAFQLTQKLKIAKADDDLKLSSIDPKEIIGAKSIVCYNAKKNMVMYICGEALSVKRSSVVEFDPTKSFSKKARNILNVKNAITSTRLYAEKALKAIKTGELEITGRLNADWLVLKAYNK